MFVKKGRFFNKEKKMTNTIRINAGSIYTPTAVLKDACVVVNDAGRIEFVGPRAKAPSAVEKTIQAEDLWLAPGLIDIHVHGGHGIGFGIGKKWAEDLEGYSKWVLESGVSGFLTSLSAGSHKELCEMMEAYVSYAEKGLPGASMVGIHLEGPYLNPERKGAFNPAWLRTPNVSEARDYLRIGGKWLKQMTMAPNYRMRPRWQPNSAKPMSRLLWAIPIPIMILPARRSWATLPM
jgi:N-acetylglucosamine-6-phosphate deacetylase